MNARARQNTTRGVVWDKPTRTIIGSMIAEISAHTVTEVMKQTGITNPTLHAKQHEVYDQLTPFMLSLKGKEDAKAKFFDDASKVFKSQAAHVAVFVAWVLIASIPFGLLGGFEFVKRYFGF